MTATEVRPETWQPTADSRGIRGLASDLAFGARLTVGGGRTSWVRLALTAVGIGLSVVVLLLATAVDPALDSRNLRAVSLVPQSDGSSYPFAFEPSEVGDGPLLAHQSTSQFNGRLLTGTDLRPLNPAAPLPPGITQWPGQGELILSPALQELLASDDGATLRPLLVGPVVGTIAPEGLIAANDLRFYRGLPATAVVPEFNSQGWGGSDFDRMQPWLLALISAGAAVVLVPLFIFVAMMARLGGAARDARNSAIRLVGGSRQHLRRMLAAETLIAAAVGLLLGLGGFGLVRLAAPILNIGGNGFYPSDLQLRWQLVLVVGIAVPLIALAAALIGARRALDSPLEMVRRTAETERPRVWIGLAILAIGSAGLLANQSVVGDWLGPMSLALWVVLILGSIPLILPWLLHLVVRLLPTNGVSQQFAVRRLQLDSRGAARAVGGICSVLAGAIALQSVLTIIAVPTRFDIALSSDSTPVMVTIRQPAATDLEAIPEQLEKAGASGFRASIALRDTTPDGDQFLAVATCDFIADVAPQATCSDGDIFTLNNPDWAEGHPAGTQVSLVTAASDVSWTVPRAPIPLASDPVGISESVILTPGALGADLQPVLASSSLRLFSFQNMDPEVVRAALAPLGWRAEVVSIFDLATQDSEVQFTSTVTTGLWLGGGLTLLVAAAGLAVLAMERLFERRRALTLVLASGVPRRVVNRSVVLGSLIPILVGCVVAAVVGIALSWYLRQMLSGFGTGVPSFAVHWDQVGIYSALAVGAVLLVTLCTLPAVRRLTRPDSLRTE